MERVVVRIGASEPAATPGLVVRKGQYLGTCADSLRKAVRSPVDAVVESLQFLREQQAYLLVLCPLPVGYPAGAAARYADESLWRRGRKGPA
ncbi:MAG: hypothetical protein ACYC3S_13380 [Chloroflexota bacterium]